MGDIRMMRNIYLFIVIFLSVFVLSGCTYADRALHLMDRKVGEAYNNNISIGLPVQEGQSAYELAEKIDGGLNMTLKPIESYTKVQEQTVGNSDIDIKEESLPNDRIYGIHKSISKAIDYIKNK